MLQVAAEIKIDKIKTGFFFFVVTKTPIYLSTLTCNLTKFLNCFSTIQEKREKLK
jgi:hypothetical protein